jgi:hypothetical protein
MPADNQYICQYHDTPAVKKDLAVRIKLNPGESIDKVWMLNPHDPDKAIAMNVRNGEVIIPELIDFCALLIQVKGK